MEMEKKLYFYKKELKHLNDINKAINLLYEGELIDGKTTQELIAKSINDFCKYCYEYLEIK